MDDIVRGLYNGGDCMVCWGLGEDYRVRHSEETITTMVSGELRGIIHVLYNGLYGEGLMLLW